MGASSRGEADARQPRQWHSGSVRRIITKALTVERAAAIHRVPLDEFLALLRTAVGQMPPP